MFGLRAARVFSHAGASGTLRAIDQGSAANSRPKGPRLVRGTSRFRDAGEVSEIGPGQERECAAGSTHRAQSARELFRRHDFPWRPRLTLLAIISRKGNPFLQGVLPLVDLHASRHGCLRRGVLLYTMRGRQTLPETAKPRENSWLNSFLW